MSTHVKLTILNQTGECSLALVSVLRKGFWCEVSMYPASARWHLSSMYLSACDAVSVGGRSGCGGGVVVIYLSGRVWVEEGRESERCPARVSLINSALSGKSRPA